MSGVTSVQAFIDEIGYLWAEGLIDNNHSSWDHLDPLFRSGLLTDPRNNRPGVRRVLIDDKWQYFVDVLFRDECGVEHAGVVHLSTQSIDTYSEALLRYDDHHVYFTCDNYDQLLALLDIEGEFGEMTLTAVAGHVSGQALQV